MTLSRSCRLWALPVAALVLVSQAAVAADGFEPSRLFPGATFDRRLPTQAEMLGVEPGARPLRHGELLRYLEKLAMLSPRAAFREYGRTHEGRPMVYFAVSDEETSSRLGLVMREHATRMDPRGRPPEQDAEVLDGAKAVAWMAYGIHGDELSSVDAAAALAYWLVAGEDEAAKRLRQELVILIDPCENPDGRERFLSQTTAFAHARPNGDMEDLSHTTVWPWGRGNHYLFDLNRDWFTMVQPESVRSSFIAKWHPQLLVDSHEMGADDTYLFSPPRHPFNPHLPGNEAKWSGRFAADQAHALDQRGYAYYTREWNEEFFPGYGSSWASYRGAVGILYEMSSTEGTEITQRSGVRRTYAEAVEHQVASSVANLTTLATHRAEILRDFVAGRREVIRQGATGAVGAWILPEGRHPERTRALLQLLEAQGIEVLHSTTSQTVSGMRDARTGAEVDPGALPDVSYMIPLDQPAGALVRVLLDPHVPMDAEFFREEREYLERGKGTRLYETTAWSVPLAYAIEAYWTPRRPGGDGWLRKPLIARMGGLEGEETPFGFVMEGTSDNSVFALAEMLERGLAVRVAAKPFRIGERAYDRAALLIKREGNPEDLGQQLREVADRWQVVIRGVPGALAEQGPDLGGRHFRFLKAPRVGIWTGMPVSPSGYGALWHLLDEQIGMRFTGLDLARFGSVDLSRYNVLIFPPTFGGPSAYRARLGESGSKRLEEWIKAGGTAIGIGGGASFLADKKSGLTRARLRSQALDRYPPVVWGPGPRRAAEGGNFRATGIRAPEDPGDDKKGDAKQQEAEGLSPYDVAPILGAGARPFAAGHDQGSAVELEPVDLAEWLKPFLPPGKTKPGDEDLEKADARLLRFSTRGAFLRIEMDEEPWLAWGVADELPALVRARDTLVAEPPVEVPARFADLDRLHLGGLLWPEAAGRLAHTAYATREGVGRGQVILFLNEPEFRGWTLGTRRLLLNAMLYGPGLGTRWSAPW